MKHEPAHFEIFITRLAFFLYGKSVYKAFADRLPLKGNERVLDFGCGMGTVAYYVAKRLPNGYLTCLDISKRWLNACRKTLRSFRNVIFLQGGYPLLSKESFDVAYCHFVLHDISEIELEQVIPALAKSLKPGGALVFSEPLNDTKKISVIKRLIGQNSLFQKDSRITDIPVMGYTLESTYIKHNET
ncbi:MAG TPA: class I SAM-dependent methyltransferase [Clostridiaceae bacterium]|nr:class I SAM-dependent methyltransferase [Clostridiaceae bacterium]